MRRFQIPDSRFQIAAAGLAAAALWLCGCALLGRRPAVPSVPVAMVAEMESLPGFDGGAPCKPEEFEEDAAKALADWATKRPSVERLITPQKARDLSSHWAKEQMKQYRRVPPLGKVAFRPVAFHKDARHLVLEGTVDTLPTHSHLVTRCLKVYLLYDLEKQAVVKVAVTIRGQLLE